MKATHEYKYNNIYTRQGKYSWSKKAQKELKKMKITRNE